MRVGGLRVEAFSGVRLSNTSQHSTTTIRKHPPNIKNSSKSDPGKLQKGPKIVPDGVAEASRSRDFDQDGSESPELQKCCSVFLPKLPPRPPKSLPKSYQNRCRIEVTSDQKTNANSNWFGIRFSLIFEAVGKTKTIQNTDEVVQN